MGWLAETNFEVDPLFGEYGDFGTMIGGIGNGQHSTRTNFGPVVHLIDETSFLMVFTAFLGAGNASVSRNIYAWPGDIASDGTATLHNIDEVINVMDLTSVVGTATPYIETIQALPAGGYAAYVGMTAEGAGDPFVVVVPDPTVGATYETVSAARTFMGDELVEFTYDSDTSELVLTQIGDTSAEFDSGDYVEIARTTSPDNAFLSVDFITATPAATLVILDTHSDGDDTNYTNYWVVEAGGSDTLTRSGIPGTTGVGPQVLPDQRLEDTLRLYGFVAVDTDPVVLETVPDDTAVVSETFAIADSNIDASTWAAFVVGDISIDATQPEPGDPFDTTTTINGVTLPSDDNYIYFSFWSDPGDDHIANWDGSVISYTLHDYAGTVPDVYLAINGVNATMLLIDGATTIDSGSLSGATISDINTAYFLSPGNPPSSKAGQLFVTFNSALFPDVPDDFFSHMVVTVTKTETITPDAAHRYKQGQYRYLNAAKDDTSAYDDMHIPGTEYMAADFFDTPAGRWTLVLGMLQDADNYGGNNLGTFAVHFESFVAALGFPPLRQWPRGDALGASSTKRVYPVPPTIQASNRRGPSAIL